MTNTQAVIASMRPPFLLLAAISVLLGVATAYVETGQIHYTYMTLAFVGALSAHISVNSFNEYFDFKSGLDFHTQKTPFSGGSGALPARPQAAHAVLMAAIAFILVTLLVGIFFLLKFGMPLLPLGLLGIIIVIGYTPYLNRQPLLCLVAPGIGFGPLMVLGTHYVLTGHYALTALLASLLPFFLANNLLLLNQFPDTLADRQAGRRTVPIRYGYRTGSYIYTAFLLLAAVSLALAVFTALLPSISLLALPVLLPALLSAHAAHYFSGDVASLQWAMALNVTVAITAPLCLALLLFLAPGQLT